MAHDAEQLRKLIREVVMEVLKRRLAAGAGAPAGAGGSAGAGKSLVLLFTGELEVPPAFLASLAELPEQGFALRAAFSHTFAQFHDVAALLKRLPTGTAQMDLTNEKALGGTVQTAAAVLMPHLSENTTAKLVLGIQDSGPSLLLAKAVAAGKPLIVQSELPAHRKAFVHCHPAAPPARHRVYNDHLQQAEQMGVQFAAGLIQAVLDAPAAEANETPRRLARERVAPKRQFITAEDVWEAISRGQKELVHPRTAVVTDQAREYAATRGFTLTAD